MSVPGSLRTYYLGIDSGGTVSKVALFDPQGREIAVTSRPVNNLRLRPDWSERDMNQMWYDTASAIREVIDRSGISSTEIAAVGCTGHGNGLYLIDADGLPVRNAINSDDCRARAIVVEWKEQGVHEVVLAKTMQSIWPAQPNALLRWLRENEPESFRRARWMLMAKDYIRFKLTGTICGEISDMSALSLIDNRTGEWDPELFRVWGIENALEKMPRIVKSTDVAGLVSKEAAQACGLAVGTPVCGGAFDIDACGLASGMLDESHYCIVSGTWGNHLFIAPQPVIHSDIFMCSRYAVDGWYLHLDGNPSAAGNLEWYLQNYCHYELSDGKSIAATYLKCDELYQESEPENCLLFMPFVNGSHLCPNASGALLGIESRHQRGDVLRAVYESVAFSHRHQLERMQRFTNKVECIRLTGGMTKNFPLVQLFSDCFQLPIWVPAGSEQGAQGAAIIASVSVGDHLNLAEASRSMTGFSHQYQPQRGRSSYMETKYQRYLSAVGKMLPVWNTIKTSLVLSE